MATPSRVRMPYIKQQNMGFHVFFLVVKTSLGVGWVAATIIPQYETTEMIKEGLEILKSWNPQWKPKFFITNKSSHLPLVAYARRFIESSTEFRVVGVTPFAARFTHLSKAWSLWKSQMYLMQVGWTAATASNFYHKFIMHIHVHTNTK